MKRTFDKDFLVGELKLPYNALEDHIIDNGRWSIHHEIIFGHEGKFYQANYSVGATECQWERPWEHVDKVVCTEVEKKQVMVEKWVPVEKEVSPNEMR